MAVGRSQGMSRLNVASIALSALGFLVVAIYLIAAPSTVVLESAIMPPRAFRKWVQSGHSTGKPNYDVPMDRFAGRGNHQKPTKMPGYYRAELAEAKKGLEEARKSVEPQMKEVNEKLAKKPTDPKLLKEKKELNKQWQETMKAATDKILTVQYKINKMNKELVNGRVHHFNNDRFLGGSDHFVPLDQAQVQLAGGGYGHSYSITDWLDGKD